MTLTARGCHLVGNGGFNTSTSFGFKHVIDAEVLFEAPPTACSPLYGGHAHHLGFNARRRILFTVKP